MAAADPNSPIRADRRWEAAAADTGRDGSAQRHHAAQLAHAQKLEAIGQLAAGIAHEINTPTQFVGDNTRFLQDAFRDLLVLLERYAGLLDAARCGTVTPAQVGEVEAALKTADLDYLSAEIPLAIQQSLEGIQRVTSIVRAMKEFAHPDTGEFKPLDLNSAVENTLTVARNEWKYVAEVVTDLEPNLPLVPCLPGEINQVLLNILINAAHAIADAIGDQAGDKGKITIRTRRAGAWVEIRIGDTGSGIPESIRTRVFDPFFTTKGVGKGTGQGLAIAHAVVVKKHHGTITFESEVGRGTTFIVRLPLDGPRAEAGAAGEEPARSAC
jgi:signal transduction histidine kinase